MVLNVQNVESLKMKIPAKTSPHMGFQGRHISGE